MNKKNKNKKMKQSDNLTESEIALLITNRENLEDRMQVAVASKNAALIKELQFQIEAINATLDTTSLIASARYISANGSAMSKIMYPNLFHAIESGKLQEAIGLNPGSNGMKQLPFKEDVTPRDILLKTKNNITIVSEDASKFNSWRMEEAEQTLRFLNECENIDRFIEILRIFEKSSNLGTSDALKEILSTFVVGSESSIVKKDSFLPKLITELAMPIETGKESAIAIAAMRLAMDFNLYPHQVGEIISTIIHSYGFIIHPEDEVTRTSLVNMCLDELLFDPLTAATNASIRGYYAKIDSKSTDDAILADMEDISRNIASSMFSDETILEMIKSKKLSFSEMHTLVEDIPASVKAAVKTVPTPKGGSGKTKISLNSSKNNKL